MASRWLKGKRPKSETFGLGLITLEPWGQVMPARQQGWALLAHLNKQPRKQFMWHIWNGQTNKKIGVHIMKFLNKVRHFGKNTGSLSPENLIIQPDFYNFLSPFFTRIIITRSFANRFSGKDIFEIFCPDFNVISLAMYIGARAPRAY
jgi:hypothetical protein